MLSKTEENRGRTLKLRSEKEENIGALPEIGFRRREPRVQSLNRGEDGNKNFPQS
jgi:hypothetical protein